MAWIGFHAIGHDLDRGLTILSDSLNTATDALTERRAQIVQDYADYEAGVSAGSVERIGEWDEDAGWIWEQSQFYEFDLTTVDETIASMRKAHVIALYHHWERVISRWALRQMLANGVTPDGNLTHGDFKKAVVAGGYDVHPRLDAVRALNNCLKHNSDDFGPKLMKRWPELFPADYKGGKGSDWFEDITITEEQMTEIVEALRTSGPPAWLPKPDGFKWPRKSGKND